MGPSSECCGAPIDDGRCLACGLLGSFMATGGYDNIEDDDDE